MPIVPKIRKTTFRGQTVWEVDARADAEMMKAYAMPVRRRFETKQQAQTWLREIVRTTSVPPVVAHGLRVRDLRDAYLRSCEAAEMSPNTVENYTHHTGVFADWCHEQEITHVDQIPRGVFYEFVDSLQARYAPTTTTVVASSCRRMFSWAVERELIEYNPASGAVPSSKATERQILTPEQQKKIERRAPLPWRHLWVVMLDTGLRRAEAAPLGDTTTMEGDHLRVLGKGQKVRRVPLSKKGARAALAALEAGIVPTSIGALDYRFDLMRTELEIDTKLHALRHTYASEMANDQRVPLPVLQLWLGHERLETTATYLHADWRQAAEAVEERAKRW